MVRARFQKSPAMMQLIMRPRIRILVVLYCKRASASVVVMEILSMFPSRLQVLVQAKTLFCSHRKVRYYSQLLTRTFVRVIVLHPFLQAQQMALTPPLRLSRLLGLPSPTDCFPRWSEISKQWPVKCGSGLDWKKNRSRGPLRERL